MGLHPVRIVLYFFFFFGRISCFLAVKVPNPNHWMGTPRRRVFMRRESRDPPYLSLCLSICLSISLPLLLSVSVSSSLSLSAALPPPMPVLSHRKERPCGKHSEKGAISNQRESPRQKLSRLHGDLDSSLQNCEKTNFFCLSHESTVLCCGSSG